MSSSLFVFAVVMSAIRSCTVAGEKFAAWLILAEKNKNSAKIKTKLITEIRSLLPILFVLIICKQLKHPNVSLP